MESSVIVMCVDISVCPKSKPHRKADNAGLVQHQSSKLKRHWNQKQAIFVVTQFLWSDFCLQWFHFTLILIPQLPITQQCYSDQTHLIYFLYYIILLLFDCSKLYLYNFHDLIVINFSLLLYTYILILCKELRIKKCA